MIKLNRLSTFVQDGGRNSDPAINYNAAAASSGTRAGLEISKTAPSRTVGPEVSGNGQELVPANDDGTRDGETRPQLKLAEAGDGSSTARRTPIPKYLDLPAGLEGSHRLAAESFSILRSRLLSVHNKLGIRSVIISSAEAGDGKTLVATNLGLSLGQLGTKRVLLVDGDLRIGRVSQIFNLRQTLGVSDFLQGNATFGSVICHTELPSLALAPAGTASKKMLSELLQGPRWPAFIEKAKKEFDLIVIDTVPVSAPVADLELLSEPCDAVLLVVRMRKTNREALKRAASRINANKFLGVVMNNADEVSEYDYSYLEGEQ